MTRFRSLFAGFSLLGLAALLAAPLTLATTPGATAASITIGSEGAIPPLDPHRVSGTVALRVIDAIYEPLVREDLSAASGGTLTIAPALAESWTVSDDGLVYTFKIRQNVTFHDGTPLDAQAVQTNFERLINPNSPVYDERASGNLSFITSWIEKTEATDSQTFVITLKEAFSGLPRLLNDRRMMIISPAAMEAHPGDELGFNPVGTGPFILESFQQGQPITLRRNDAYWKGAPKLESLTFEPITDPTALAIAMQTGRVDVIPSASAAQVAQLKGESDLEVQYTDTPNAYYIRLNARAELTRDVRFRQALNYAVNREAIAALFDGQASPMGMPVPKGNEIHGLVSDIPVYTFDPEKAKALIAEMGLQTPITLNLLAANSGPGFGLSQQVMTLIQQDFAAVGIDLQIQFMEFSTLVSTERGGYADDVHGSYNGWATGVDAAYFFERMFGGNQQPPNGVNRGWYQNDEVDAFFAQGRGAVNDDERLGAYVDAIRIVTDEAPWVFLYQDRLPRIVRNSISGIEPVPSLYFDYANVTVE